DPLLGARPTEAVHTRARDDRPPARRSRALPLDALLGRRSDRSSDPRARPRDRTRAGIEARAGRSGEPSATSESATARRPMSTGPTPAPGTLGGGGRAPVPAETLLNGGTAHFTADPGLLHGFPVNLRPDLLARLRVCRRQRGRPSRPDRRRRRAGRALGGL